MRMDSPKQPHPFDPRKAAALDDPERERWFPTDALLILLDVSTHALVLDYGTGTARYALKVAAKYPAARVSAFDFQAPMLQIARERVRDSNLQNIAVVGPAAASLEGSFDRIMAINVLHEIEVADLHQIRDLLKPDGFALFIDWDASIPRDFGPPAHHAYTVDEARGRLRSTGFESRVIAEPRFPYHYVVRAHARLKAVREGSIT